MGAKEIADNRIPDNHEILVEASENSYEDKECKNKKDAFKFFVRGAEWVVSKITGKTKDDTPRTWSSEMQSLILAMALRNLSMEQRNSLCADLYVRSENTDDIDKRINEQPPNH